jgi:hypothetical protein
MDEQVHPSTKGDALPFVGTKRAHLKNVVRADGDTVGLGFASVAVNERDEPGRFWLA